MSILWSAHGSDWQNNRPRITWIENGKTLNACHAIAVISYRNKIYTAKKVRTWVAKHISISTDPKAWEVGVGVVVGLVVSLHQRGDDLALLLAQPGSLRLPLRLLILPPLDQILLPLHLLICQDDWGRGRRRGDRWEEEWWERGNTASLIAFHRSLSQISWQQWSIKWVSITSW